MKQIRSLAFLLLFAVLFTLDSCKSKKCGCEQETIFVVDKQVGRIYGKPGENYAYIESETSYSRFELCNAEDLPDDIQQKLDPTTSVRVIFSGEAKDDCIKLYYQWYYYYYNIIITDIEKID